MTISARSVGIIGLGSYVPDKIVSNADLEKVVDTSDEWIYERTGIRERRVATGDMATSDLAVRAAQRALENAKISASELDLIIVGTVTPDMIFPAVACMVQDRLGAEKAAAFDLSAGCSGFVYGITVASQFIQTGLYKKVLVIGAELFSKMLDWQDRNTCILFGDGAGAAVLGEVPAGYGLLGVDMGAEGSGASLLNLPGGGTRYPASEETIAKRMHFLQMNGREVYKFASQVVGRAVFDALRNAGLTAKDIDVLVPHQANSRIIQSAAKRLGMPLEKVIVNVDKYANTSAASIPIALDEAVQADRIKTGDIVALVGFGAGLTWAAGVMKWYKEE